MYQATGVVVEEDSEDLADSSYDSVQSPLVEKNSQNSKKSKGSNEKKNAKANAGKIAGDIIRVHKTVKCDSDDGISSSEEKKSHSSSILQSAS